MPIYEYRCTACGGVFEKIQRFSDPPLDSCEVCRGTLEKLVSRTAFLLKGGGWYSSGYTKSGGGSDSPSEVGGKPESGSGKPPASGSSPEPDKPAGGGCGASCACH
jgi:putative FmdB family regulatory protein